MSSMSPYSSITSNNTFSFGQPITQNQTSYLGNSSTGNTQNLNLNYNIPFNIGSGTQEVPTETASSSGSYSQPAISYPTTPSWNSTVPLEDYNPQPIENYSPTPLNINLDLNSGLQNQQDCMQSNQSGWNSIMPLLILAVVLKLSQNNNQNQSQSQCQNQSQTN